MDSENKSKGIQLNDKTLYENIKEFDMLLTQEERVKFIKNFLCDDNGMLKKDISCLYDYMCNPNSNKRKSPLNTNQIEGFFEILANYILYSPDDDSGLVEKHNNKIIDEKQVISDGALNYVDNDINDMYKNNNKNEYKENKIKINHDEVYDPDYIENKLKEFNLTEENEKYKNTKNLYTTYQKALVQIQEAVDDLVHQKVNHIKGYEKIYKTIRTYNDNMYMYNVYDLENNRLICSSKFMKHIIDAIKIEHRHNGYVKFVKYLEKNNILNDDITLSNYIKIAKEKYPEFKIEPIEYVYNDVNLKKVNNVILELRQEMIALKKGMLKILHPKDTSGTYKYDIDYDVDWLDKENMSLLLNCHYNKDIYDFTTNIDCVLYDFNQIVKDCDFNPYQQQIIKLSEQGYQWESKSSKVQTIASIMGKNGLALWQQRKGIVTIIANKSYDRYEDWYYLVKVKGQYKKCSKCGEVKLVSYFDKHPNTKDGYDHRCVECKKENNKQRKRCTKCGKTKFFSEFGKDSRKKDGLKSSCKACDSISKRKKC